MVWVRNAVGGLGCCSRCCTATRGAGLDQDNRYPHSVCRYAESQYKVHYVCVPCRKSNKYPWDGAGHLCPECRAPMVFAGHDFAAPRRHDKSGWAAVAAVLEIGLRYEGFETCDCSRDPKFRPRTSAQVRARRRLADRTGIDVAVMLAARDPYSVLDTGDQSPELAYQLASASSPWCSSSFVLARTRAFRVEVHPLAVGSQALGLPCGAGNREGRRKRDHRDDAVEAAKPGTHTSQRVPGELLVPPLVVGPVKWQ